jgi:Ca2+-binding EF-hand superfamily protein
MIKEMDGNQDGKISFEEFSKTLTRYINKTS